MFSVKNSFPWISNRAYILAGIFLTIPSLFFCYKKPHIAFCIIGIICSTILLHCCVNRGYFFALAPITWIILSFFLSTVLGASLMWYGISYRFGGAGEILPEILMVQINGIVALISLFIGYSLLHTKNLNKLTLSKQNKEFLFLIFLISLIYAFVHQISSVYLFQIYRYEVEAPHKIFHAINAFQKLSFIWFFLIPLFIKKAK